MVQVTYFIKVFKGCISQFSRELFEYLLSSESHVVDMEKKIVEKFEMKRLAF